MGNLIHCPKCGGEVEVSAALREELENELRATLQTELDRRVGALAASAEQRYAREATERVRLKEVELEEARSKLAMAAAREADLLKRQRELAEREAQSVLDVERRVADEIRRVRDQEAILAQQRRELEDGRLRLRDEEHRQQIEGMQKHIEELQRRAQQGSQQAQGEAQEVALRDLLMTSFPLDSVEDVAKGVTGADLVQRVRATDGLECGAILWESKRTKAWSEPWLAKLRDDVRTIEAAAAVIVTQALPPDVQHFVARGGVWICAWPYAAALGAVLRAGLIEVARARRAAEGRGEKMQMVYDYLTGSEFRNRVGGFVEAFKEMQEQLDGERRAMMTAWKRRERLMERALTNVTALYGDLQGIAGRRLEDLPLLTFEAEEPCALPADDVVGTPEPSRTRDGRHAA